MWFQVASTCQIEGTVEADGEAGVSHMAGGVGGGGAGGTIRFSCGTFSGAGSLSANGGNGGGDLSAGCCGGNNGTGGGGSGGRIVVRSIDHGLFSGKASARVDGGTGGTGPGIQGAAGGRGTIAFITLSALSDPLTTVTTAEDVDIEIYQGWRWEPSQDAPFNYNSVVVHPGSIVVGGDGAVTLQANTFTMENASWDSTVPSSNGGTSEGNVSIEAGQLTLSTSTLSVSADSNRWTFDVSSALTLDETTLDGLEWMVVGTANVSIQGNTYVSAQTIALEGSSLALGELATLSGDARGHPSATGVGAGANGVTGAGGGAGHGREGGSGGSGALGGARYGVILLPLSLIHI